MPSMCMQFSTTYRYYLFIMDRLIKTFLKALLRQPAVDLCTGSMMHLLSLRTKYMS